jgi:hypothetical protein
MLRQAILTTTLLVSTVQGTATTLEHHLTVRLEPAAGRIEVSDRITPADPQARDLRFVLHADLAPEVRTPGWRLEPAPGPVDASFVGINVTSENTGRRVPLEGYRLIAEDGAERPVEIAYAGIIRHELATSGEEYQRSFSETPGLIGPDGVFLSGTSYWLPTFGEGLMRFSLEVVDLDPSWHVVSSGHRVRSEVMGGQRVTAWRMEHPTEEAYLVAGPWTEYADRLGDLRLYAFLRTADDGLASRYLEAAKRYMKLYESMLTPHPYRTFAVVENFWETGYGMPGFTLLGSRILRFPWILTSSFPHEILHDWWGNSVYVDFDAGNWCEGLTAYLADHLFAEQRGEGATHRRATLQKFTDFVGSGDDVPLVDFRSRHSAASEAVGYGKSLMVFHMLRRAVGDEAFLAALRRFDDAHRFERASWSDVAEAVSEETGADWVPWVMEWTARTGAPRLEIASVTRERTSSDDAPWRLRLQLRQVQEEEAFPVTIPVAVTVAGRDEALMFEVTACGARECELEATLPAEPLRIDVDPEFDVMRRLDPMEVPPALSTVFGAERTVFVLPAAAPEAELEAWRELAAAWAQPDEPGVVLDRELETLPGGAVWVLGAANRFADEIVSRLAVHRVSRRPDGLNVGPDLIPALDHSTVLVARGDDPETAVAWIAADPVTAIPGLTRKLPHYTRYSSLGFKGPEPENMSKGLWQAVGSPLVRQLGAEPVSAALPPRPPLAELPPVFDAGRMAATVATLAAPEMEGRGLGSAGLAAATLWTERQLEAAGVRPAGDAGFRQVWSWRGGHPERLLSLTNLVARIPGSDPDLAPVLMMAHLDHLGRGWPDVREGFDGLVHPGADDNASGVAVLLEVARALASEPARARDILIAVTTAEEAGLVGSRHLIESLGADQRPFACVNLDTVGRLADSGKLYVLNTDSAREWRFAFMGVGYTTGAPVEIVAEPLDASDQVACLDAGVPAVQLFTGPTPDYHRPSDSPESVDAEGMAVVAEATREIVSWLADRTDPLTVNLGDTGPEAGRGGEPNDDAPRRAALGTVPDFAYPGPGVRVEDLVPGSAAEAAGLRAGDVLVAFDGKPIDGLRGYSEALKAHAPGDTVVVTVERDGERLELTATLTAR